MKLTCDLCKIETDDVRFDDIHGAMGGSYAFICAGCYQINDKFWELSGVIITAELEITMVKRALRRIAK